MPVNGGGREQAERALAVPSSAHGRDAEEPSQRPALEGPPPREMILLDSISVGPGKVVDVMVPRDRSVPPPDELIDPFVPVQDSGDPESDDRDSVEFADGNLNGALPRTPTPGRRRTRLADLWRRLLRLFRASSRS